MTVIKELLVNILFIWSKENKDVSYKQGMNEILAVIFYGVYPYYFPVGKNKPTPEKIIQLIGESSTSTKDSSKDIYLYFHDSDEIGGDLYYLFDAVMAKGVKELYEVNDNKIDKSSYKKFDLFHPQWSEGEDLQKVND